MTDPNDPEWVDYIATMQTLFNAQRPTPAEIAAARDLAEQIVEREREAGTLVTKGPNNAATARDRWPRELLKDIMCPTTVIQADMDQFFGEAHGKALVEDINAGGDVAEYAFGKRGWVRALHAGVGKIGGYHDEGVWEISRCGLSTKIAQN